MSNILLKKSSVIKKYLKTNIPFFVVGSLVTVSYKIVEGNKHRIQNFQGIVTNRKGGNSLDATFTVTKNSVQGIKVERTFPLHSPNIENITVDLLQRSRRSNLNKLAMNLKDLSKKLRSKIIKIKDETNNKKNMEISQLLTKDKKT